jgi:golgi-specific brefeldin A-resistance guanine nucleotide exchange factor 1
MDALLDQLPDDESSTVPVISVKSETMSSPSSSGGNKAAHTKLTYDPAIVYILEFATVLALKNSETIEFLGKYVAEALQMILRNSSRYHSALVSRAAYYQFNMLKASYVSHLRILGEIHSMSLAN